MINFVTEHGLVFIGLVVVAYGFWHSVNDSIKDFFSDLSALKDLFHGNSAKVKRFLKRKPFHRKERSFLLRIGNTYVRLEH